MDDRIAARWRPPALTGWLLAGVALAALVADLLQPVLPLAGLLLAASLAALLGLTVWSVLSLRRAGWRRLALVAAGLLAGVLASLIVAQGQSEARLARGVLAAEIGFVGAVQGWFVAEAPQQSTPPPPASAPDSPRVLAAMTVDAETDPRRALARLGLDWGEQPFRTAIEAADTTAVRLYLMGGLTLSGPVARAYVDPHYRFDDTFNPEVAALVTELEGVEVEDFCLATQESWTHLLVHRRDLPHTAARRDFVRDLCGQPGILDQLTDRLQTADARLKAQIQANAARPDRVTDCAEAFKAAHPVGPTFQAAARFSLFDVTTLEPPGDTVLAELNGWLLAGAGGDPVEAFDQAVTRGCEAAHPLLAIDTRQRDTVVDVLRLLMAVPVASPVSPAGTHPPATAP